MFFLEFVQIILKLIKKMIKYKKNGNEFINLILFFTWYWYTQNKQKWIQTLIPQSIAPN